MTIPARSAGPISMLFEMNREDNPRLYDVDADRKLTHLQR